jgi:hypothetical protein
MSTALDNYLPNFGELSPEQLQNARIRVEAYLRDAFPELDMRPTSVFGDHFVTPAAYHFAALEEATRRFKSDTLLENVANKTIYDCNFVEAFLKNFAVTPTEGVADTGVIRLTLLADEDFYLDRRTQFKFGESIFRIFLPQEGHLYIHQVGTTPIPNTNARVLRQIASNRWVIDLLIVGSMTTPILAGDTGETDFLPDDNANNLASNLESITALADFSLGQEPVTLPTLAKKTRETFYSKTFNTRMGGRKLVMETFPALKAVSVLTTGDAEMLRAPLNPFGVAQGAIDVVVKSQPHVYADSFVVGLEYDTTTSKYYGKLVFPSTPILIDSITPVTPLSNWNQSTNVDILSRSVDSSKYPLLLAAYSGAEEFYMRVARSSTDIPFTIVGGKSIAYFRVDYRFDPYVKVTDDLVNSKDVKPVGLTTHVKAFVPVVIKSMTVTYTRARGTTVNIETAREEIYNYINSLGYPELLSDARIYDSMFYAGAKNVKSIRCQAVVQWSIANMTLKTTASAPTNSVATDWQTWHDAGDMLIPPLSERFTSSTLGDTFIDPFLTQAGETLCAVGDRNISYILDANDIHFSEVLV